MNVLVVIKVLVVQRDFAIFFSRTKAVLFFLKLIRFSVVIFLGNSLQACCFRFLKLPRLDDHQGTFLFILIFRFVNGMDLLAAYRIILVIEAASLLLFNEGGNLE